MGNTYSFLAAEKKTWICHTLEFDAEVRKANLAKLDQFVDGKSIYMSYVASSWGGLKYQHWFVTDRVRFFEFGSANLDIYRARVTINTNPGYNYPIDVIEGIPCYKPMDDEVRERMRHVLGMSNYSLYFRNCEHVANYVFRSRWVSRQMDISYRDMERRGWDFGARAYFSLIGCKISLNQGNLMSHFQEYMRSDQIRLVNTFPAAIRSHLFDKNCGKVYSFIDNNAIPTRVDYYLDYDENTYNILVIGPTGAGKSNFINTLFNKKICESGPGLKLVTNEVYCVRGRHHIYNSITKQMEEKNIVVADTIGLCDWESDERTTINMIRNRVNSNFKYVDIVFFIFRADRLPTQVITSFKKILNWHGYSPQNAARFIFVGTFADHVSESEKLNMSYELRDILHLHHVTLPNGEELDNIIYVGFPPERDLTPMTCQYIINMRDKIMRFINYPPQIERLVIARETSPQITITACAIL